MSASTSEQISIGNLSPQPPAAECSALDGVVQEARRDQVLVKARIVEQRPDLDDVPEERSAIRGASLADMSLGGKGVRASQQRRSNDPVGSRGHG